MSLTIHVSSTQYVAVQIEVDDDVLCTSLNTASKDLSERKRVFIDRPKSGVFYYHFLLCLQHSLIFEYPSGNMSESSDNSKILDRRFPLI